MIWRNLVIINSYKNGSRSAKKIKTLLRQRIVDCWTRQLSPKNPQSLVINWGNSAFQYPIPENVVNHPAAVGKMTNKIRFFEATEGSKDVLEWTKNKEVALKWATPVFARTKIEASGGKGIIVFDPETDEAATLPSAPLYTRYVPKTHEYRLHLARSLKGKKFQCLLAQRKVFVKTPERPSPLDWKVRSHDNGFIFQRQPEMDRIPVPVMDSACRVMSTYFPDLHFVALDVMYHQKRNQAWVIEGNTAPGLENASVSVYADYFQALEKEHKQCLLK